jgi:hypothetical protein
VKRKERAFEGNRLSLSLFSRNEPTQKRAKARWLAFEKMYYRKERANDIFLKMLLKRVCN